MLFLQAQFNQSQKPPVSTNSPLWGNKDSINVELRIVILDDFIGTDLGLITIKKFLGIALENYKCVPNSSANIEGFLLS